MVSGSWLRASPAGKREEWRRDGAREVAGVGLMEPVGDLREAVSERSCGCAVPGTESMLARAEAGAVCGEA